MNSLFPLGTGCILLGMALGFALCTKPADIVQPINYCINNVVYEKADTIYISVVPPRTCLPVDTD
jgi:hypothetical protein